MILLAGANARNLALLEELLARLGYACRQACGMAELDAALDAGQPFELALVDVTGFDASIWRRCQRLHETSTPLIVISPRQSADLRNQGLAHGARDVLVKPLAMRELTALVRSLLCS
ncbi:MAG: hypothetical protein N2690_04380 [Rhodocyclaceae bacterium]|nr:hypothetical protein [Rhodocyclaceae bacterium]